MASPKNPEVFYVGIQNTIDLRRNIIESTKDAIVFLQKYEGFLKLRTDKNHTIVELKKIIKEISTMVSNLKRQLPESEIHKKLGKQEVSVEKEILGIALDKKQAQVKFDKSKTKIARTLPKKTTLSQGSKPVNEKAVNEMDKLESQLKDLENKLRGFE